MIQTIGGVLSFISLLVATVVDAHRPQRDDARDPRADARAGDAPLPRLHARAGPRPPPPRGGGAHRDLVGRRPGARPRRRARDLGRRGDDGGRPASPAGPSSRCCRRPGSAPASRSCSSRSRSSPPGSRSAAASASGWRRSSWRWPHDPDARPLRPPRRPPRARRRGGGAGRRRAAPRLRPRPRRPRERRLLDHRPRGDGGGRREPRHLRRAGPRHRRARRGARAAPAEGRALPLQRPDDLVREAGPAPPHRHLRPPAAPGRGRERRRLEHELRARLRGRRRRRGRGGRRARLAARARGEDEERHLRPDPLLDLEEAPARREGRVPHRRRRPLQDRHLRVREPRAGFRAASRSTSSRA